MIFELMGKAIAKIKGREYQEVLVFSDVDQTPEFISCYEAAYNDPEPEKFEVAETILSHPDLTPLNPDYRFALGYSEGYKAAMRARANY